MTEINLKMMFASWRRIYFVLLHHVHIVGISLSVTNSLFGICSTCFVYPCLLHPSLRPSATKHLFLSSCIVL